MKTRLGTKTKLWLGLVTLQTFLLVVAFVGQWQVAIGVAQQQLQQHAQLGADSLALAMVESARKQDFATASIYVDSIYNRGGFKHIRLVLVDGFIAVDRNDATETGAVKIQKNWPDWFESLFPIESGYGYAELLSDWHLVGFVDVRTSTGALHFQYWKSFKQLVFWYSILLLVGYLGLGWLLHRKRDNFKNSPQSERTQSSLIE